MPRNKTSEDMENDVIIGLQYFLVVFSFLAIFFVIGGIGLLIFRILQWLGII